MERALSSEAPAGLAKLRALIDVDRLLRGGRRLGAVERDVLPLLRSAVEAALAEGATEKELAGAVVVLRGADTE